MARITVEDCLGKVDNRFGLIHLAARRVRQLRKGAEPLVICKNKDIVVSLREIAAGKVSQVKDEDSKDLLESQGDLAVQEIPGQIDEEPPSKKQIDQETMAEGK